MDDESGSNTVDRVPRPIDDDFPKIEVLTAETITDEQKTDLSAARPTAAEIAADRWDDEVDAAAEAP